MHGLRRRNARFEETALPLSSCLYRTWPAYTLLVVFSCLDQQHMLSQAQNHGR